MTKLKKKKIGFTLTELAIVIAVIAILVAVLVPTFVSLINKADESVDQQTVRNMNTSLTTEEVDGEPDCLCEVWQILEDAGYNPTPSPVYSDNAFYWYRAENRIVIVSNEAITYPSNYSSVAFTGDETVFIRLDTDESNASVHSYDYSKGVCTVCGAKTTATAVSTTTDFASKIAETGNVALTENISISSTTSLTTTNLSEVSIDLNGYTLTTTASIKMEYNCNNSADDSPESINISNGLIYCNYSSGAALRYWNANSVTFTNVTFINTADVAFYAVQFYLSDATVEYNYVFKSCNFVNTYVAFNGASGDCYDVNSVFMNCTFSASLSTTNRCVSYNACVYGETEFDNCTFTVTATKNNSYAIFVQASSSVGDNKLIVTLNNVTYKGTSSGYSNLMLLKFAQTTYGTGEPTYGEVIETGTNSYKNDGVAVNYKGESLS